MSSRPVSLDHSETGSSVLSALELRNRLELQFRHLSPDERANQIDQLLEAHSRQRLSLNDSLAVAHNGQSLGVLTIARQTDGTINFWPVSLSAELSSKDADQIRTHLYSQAIEILESSDCWIAQCLLSPQDVSQSRELDAVGVPKLTELSFLAKSLDAPLPETSTPSSLRIETYESQFNRQRFANLLERTWQGTLDCPELNGSRTGLEALDGHGVAGEFSPARWLLFSVDQADVGVLLLTDHPDEQVWEIVYFGVASEARGQGLGRVILLEGLRRARQAGALEVVLAVDARNSPALKLYTKLGFRPFDRRIVHALLRAPAN